MSFRSEKLEPLLFPVFSFTLSSGFLCLLVFFRLTHNHYRHTLLTVFLLPSHCINNSHFSSAQSFFFCSPSRSFLPLHFPSTLVTCVCRFLCVCRILQLPLENVEVILLPLLRRKKEKKFCIKADGPNGFFFILPPSEIDCQQFFFFYLERFR